MSGFLRGLRADTFSLMQDNVAGDNDLATIPGMTLICMIILDEGIKSRSKEKLKKFIA